MRSRTMKYVIVAIAILFSMPASFAVWHGTAGANASVRAITSVYPGANIRLPAPVAKIQSSGISMSDVFLPNFNARERMVSGHVQPLYPQAPAPMGVGDFGLKTVDGQLVGYNLETESIEGVAYINDLSAYPITSLFQGRGSIQLNTVITNVTLFGVTNYTYWTQNVVSFSQNFHFLTMVLNIWNFSTPTFGFPPNGIASGKGHVLGHEVYITRGPSFYIAHLPALVILYTNAAVVNGNSTVFFNYSISADGVVHSGTFDEVQFNSTWGMPAGYSAPMPYYLISGTKVTPTNFLLYDAELMIGGPGGGSNNDITDISGTMNLYYQTSSGQYVSVPSAYDFGTDTGETSTGVNSWWQGETAILNTGPSLLYGMWGVSQMQPRQYTGIINPSNAFMFVSPGSQFNLQTDAWVTTSLSGYYDFHVPFNELSGVLMLSFYDPISFTLTPGYRDFALTHNTGMGIYTPLYAFDEQQAGNLALAGAGEPGDPYLITGFGAFINPVFAQFNDYLFPVFVGVFFTFVTWTDLVNLPPLIALYPGQLVQQYGLPSPVNILNIILYSDDFVNVWDAHVGGWFTDTQLPYSIALLNDYFSLVGDTVIPATGAFSTASHRVGGGMIIFGGQDNTVWGNTFDPFGLTGGGSGLTVDASNNLIYNNLFNYGVYPTAVSPAAYFNRWNIEPEPAGTISIVNGLILSGSIVGGNYQGGNWWWNFNPASYSLKGFYNDNGFIANGGDHYPLNVLDPGS